MSCVLLLATLFIQDPHAHHQPAPAQAAPGLAEVETDRNASGTAWQPVEVPHAGWHLGAGGWRLMVHGVLFGGYDWQARPRGGRAAVGLGWLMGMARRDGASNVLVLRTMLSPEP